MTVKLKDIIISGIIAIFVFLCAPHSYAQSSHCSVSGHIAGQDGMPIAYAAVVIYDGNAALCGAISDSEGAFKLILDRTKADYELVVEFIGYCRHSQTIRPEGNRIDAGTIILKEDSVHLDAAAVSAKEIDRRSTIEHTVINAGANMASDKGTAIDILRSSSSVTMLNDEIAIRGNTNILVLMDGIPTTVTDLSAIPAGSIKSIEVITNPDATYDGSGSGGIINIVSRRTSMEGISGMVSVNYGFNHFVAANAAISYNKPGASYRFSYNTRYEDDIVNTALERHIKSTGYNVDQMMTAERYTFTNNLSFGTDFRINPKNKLVIDAKLMIPRINIRQDLKNEFAAYAESRHNDVTWNRENIEGSINYTHIFKPDVSELSFAGSASKTWGHRPSFYYLEGTMTGKSDSGGSPFIASAQADYKHIFKAGTLTTGVKLTFRRNDIYHNFYEYTDDQWQYSFDLSNDLLHCVRLPSAYAMFSSRTGSRFTYKAGLRTEISILSLDSEHNEVDLTICTPFLLPSFSGTYKLGEEQDISLAYSRRIGYPTYPQLNPYMSMVDAVTFEQGNMYLKPEKASKVDLSYSLGRPRVNLMLNAYAHYTAEYISQITTIDNDRLITTYINTASDLKSGLDVSLRVKVSRWMNVSLAANTYHMSSEGEYKGAVVFNRGLTNNSNILLDFMPWKGADLQCQYFVTTPQYFPQLTSSLTHQMNVGLKQNMMKGSMTLSILLTDVFNTARWEVRSQNNIFDLTNISRNKSRMLWLGLSYNFNSFKQKSVQKNDNDRSLIRLGL